MNASRLIKLAPNAILLAFVGYAFFSLRSALPGAASEQAALEKGFELMLRDLATSGAGATAELGQIRNPFLVVAPPAAAAADAEPAADAESETDQLAEIIASLTLDATFIQGHDQLAIINGRIYYKGQSLALPGDPEKTQPPVVVLFVKLTGVLLRSGGKNYMLGYPERLGKKPAPSTRTPRARPIRR